MMSIQAAASNANGTNPFFDQLPKEATRSIFEHLKKEKGTLSPPGDDKSIVTTARVCRNWQNNPILKQEQHEARARIGLQRVLPPMIERVIERDYPPKMVELFRNSHLDISKLPILDVKVRHLFIPEIERISHQIDYSDLDKQKMTHRIMRFKTEDGRPGIAVHVQTVSDRIIQLAGQRLRFPGPDAIFAIYKAAPHPADQRWEYAWITSEEISIGEYEKDQNGIAEHISLLAWGLFGISRNWIPFGGGLNHAFLSQILHNRNWVYRIFSEEERINGPLPF